LVWNPDSCLSTHCSNTLSRDGARHLAVLLKSNPPLLSLDVGYNRIEDDGLAHISDALIANCTLTRCSI